MVGWILGLTVVRTRSLAMAVGLHGGWILALVLLYACSSDEQLFSGTPASTSSTGGAGGGGNGGGGEGGVAGGGMGGMAGGGGMGGRMDVCENEPQDSSCVVCIKLDCCPEFTQCRGNMQCMCWLGCREEGKSNFECISDCGGDAPQEFIDLTSCVAMNCSTQCQ